MARDGFVLLGPPVGSESFCSSYIYISSRVKKIQDIILLLPNLEDSQMENALLHSCLSIPKFLFFYEPVLQVT